MKTFRSYQLALSFYKQCRTLDLPYHLKDQLQRAASSIALNLAEGSGKRTPADQKRFYQIAFGSLRECQAVLDLAETDSAALIDCADHLGASVYKLIKGTG